MSPASVADSEIAIQVFAVAVFRYCSRVGGSVTSWIRTPRRNLSVGGVMRSKHVSGLAVDVVVESYVTCDDRHLLAADLGLKLVIESDHDHLELL